MTTPNGAGSNPLAGGSNANTPPTNPLVGGSANLTPAQGAPDGKQPANPLAGGQNADQNAPENENISPDVFREKMRSEAALRKRVQELEERVKREEDAKLTDDQRRAKALEEYQEKERAWLSEKKAMRLQSAVENRTRERNLVDPKAVATLLQTEYGEQIDYDEDGTPRNAEYLVDRLIEKYAWLVRPPETPAPPNAGRNVAPNRSPSGQYTPQRPATPKPVEQWAKLGDYDWSKPDGDKR